MRHINKEHGKGRRKEPARVTASQRKAVELEAKTGRKHINPAQEDQKQTRDAGPER